MDKYVVYDSVGTGAHSTVFKARYLVRQRVCFSSILGLPWSCLSLQGRLQYLSLQRFDKHNMARGQRKFRMGARASHPNVVAVFAECETSSQVSDLVADYFCQSATVEFVNFLCSTGWSRNTVVGARLHP